MADLWPFGQQLRPGAFQMYKVLIIDSCMFNTLFAPILVHIVDFLVAEVS